MKQTALYIVLASTLLWVGCNRFGRQSLPYQGNSAYYWRTAFELDSLEQSFLEEHDISRLYCRYFDVVMNDTKGPVPNATLQFRQVPPSDVELVPTVFIMNDCMQPQALSGTDGRPDVPSLARNTVRRIVQMNETHDISGVREIQIDCDYTVRNRELYYAFLTEVSREAQTYGLQVSVTIRLHQLSMPAPPVCYGVLMLYNTGNPERFAERNPILDVRDVQPYVRHLADYPLPLGAAYPCFLWNRRVHGVDISHVADYDDILRTKDLVEAERGDLRQLILTYHLDTENINRYTSEQYEEIYRH